MKVSTLVLLALAGFAAFKAVEAAPKKQQVGAIPGFNPRLRSQG